MSISEQVKKLREYSNISLYTRESGARELLKEAADTIEALSAKLQAANTEQGEGCGRWIPCSERLPDKRDNYLCTIECSHGHRFRMIGHYNLPGWTEDNKMQQTIAWQPLPEEYHG